MNKLFLPLGFCVQLAPEISWWDLVCQTSSLKRIALFSNVEGRNVSRETLRFNHQNGQLQNLTVFLQASPAIGLSQLPVMSR